MLFRGNKFYLKHPEKCHIYTEIGKRSKVAENKIEKIFNFVLSKSRTFSENYWGFVALHEDFDKALFCHGLGLDSFCLVEIYSVLESRIIQTIDEEFLKLVVSRKFGKFLSERSHVARLEYFLRRVKSSELAKIYQKMGVIEKEDYKFISELENIRDAIAHKNLNKISHFNIRSHNAHFHTLDSHWVKFDIENIFFKAVKFEWKIFPEREKKKFLKDSEKLLEELKEEYRKEQASNEKNKK